MTPDERIARVRWLLNEATPGPWELDEAGSVETTDGCAIAFINDHKYIPTIQRTGECFNDADGHLIAEAPEHLLALVEEIERLKDTISRGGGQQEHSRQLLGRCRASIVDNWERKLACDKERGHQGACFFKLVRQ